jgi:hypothetical protein
LNPGTGSEAKQGAPETRAAEQGGVEEGHEEPPKELGIIERRVSVAVLQCPTVQVSAIPGRQVVQG